MYAAAAVGGAPGDRSLLVEGELMKMCSVGRCMMRAREAVPFRRRHAVIKRWFGGSPAPGSVGRVVSEQRQHSGGNPKSIADLQRIAVAEWLQSFNSVRGPMEKLGII